MPYTIPILLKIIFSHDNKHVSRTCQSLVSQVNVKIQFHRLNSRDQFQSILFHAGYIALSAMF